MRSYIDSTFDKVQDASGSFPRHLIEGSFQLRCCAITVVVFMAGFLQMMFPLTSILSRIFDSLSDAFFDSYKFCFNERVRYSTWLSFIAQRISVFRHLNLLILADKNFRSAGDSTWIGKEILYTMHGFYTREILRTCG